MENHEHEHHENHITSYTTLAKVLIGLLFLTFITVAVTGIHLGPLTVAVALLIACVKGGIVLTWFMHLKFELPVFRYMVLGVFLLFALIIIITFFDYAFR
jgi:cytochrome c oxidase subunit 4